VLSLESTDACNLFASFGQSRIVPSGIPHSWDKLAFDSLFLTLLIILNFSFGPYHHSLFYFLVYLMTVFTVALLTSQ
jgi:hypothetical protein